MEVKQKIIKRLFDIFFSIIGIIVLGWMIILYILFSTIDTKSLGIFRQKRVGFNGKEFYVFKIRTMKNHSKITTTVTVANDVRITSFGKFLRKHKLDELPQLFNIFIGDMSFVGPRPDVKGFADKLTGDDRIILSVRPGLTGPATIYFRNEEELLAEQENPEVYNRRVIWPKKVAINKDYIKNYTFKSDLIIIFKTLLNA